MQPLSPVDAVSPAFQRIQQIVLPKARPRRWGRALKLCACSYLASVGSVFLPFPVFALALPQDILPAGIRLGLAGLAAVFLVLTAIIFYCGVRMEFVEFHVVATGETRIGPIWRRYGSRVWAFFFLKMVAGVLVCVAFLPLVASVARGFIDLIKQSGDLQAAKNPDPAIFFTFFHAIYGFYALILGTYFLLKIFSTVLHDLVLPFYALEDIPLSAAIRKAWAICRAEPGEVALYFFLKPLLTLVGLVAIELVVGICAIPLFLIVFTLAFTGAFLVATTQSAAVHVLLIALGVILYLAVYGCFIAVVIGVTGYLMSLLEGYGVFFLASRYPRLAELLYGPASGPSTPPPPVPPPPPARDHGGPPLPINPALA